MATRRKRRRHDATGRSEEGQYMVLPYSMVRHSAWRSLSGPAVKVWIELRSRFNGGNNGKLALSLDEAARLLGIGKATALRAFNELAVKGFVTLTRRGQWYGRLASEWAVTDQAVDGERPTREWQGWQPTVVQKRKLGADADPDAYLTGPPENRSPSPTVRAGTRG